MQMEKLFDDLKEINKQKIFLFDEYSQIKNELISIQSKQLRETHLNNNLFKPIDNDQITKFPQPDSENSIFLKNKLRELEKKCALQNLRHEEVLLEIEAISKGKMNVENIKRNFIQQPEIQDGFYYGETMDKRRGLIPSAYVDDIKFTRIAENSNLANLFGFIDDIPAEEDIPGPRCLQLEKLLANSALISWKKPEGFSRKNLEINAFHIYFDGQFRVSVKATEKTRALVENVESDRPHRISVRSVTNKGQSKDAQCTIEIGKGSTPTPGRLKATKISYNSAKLSWLPGNSNYPHAVFLNDIEIKKCDPGVYKFHLIELPADTLHRICIQAITKEKYEEIGKPRIPPKFNLNLAKNCGVDKKSFAAFIEFRTLPIGLPDPPTRVQIEPGPQDGHILVTWKPVDQNARTDINNESKDLPVQGYTIALNGKTLKKFPDYKTDHAVIELEELKPVIQSIHEERLKSQTDDEISNEILLTVHSIVKKDADKLGPTSRPVILTNEVILTSSGSLGKAVSIFGPELAEQLGLNEAEALRFNVPLEEAVPQEEEQEAVSSENNEDKSLTIPAGSVVRQESLSRQSEAANVAETLLNNRKKENASNRHHPSRNDSRYNISNRRSRMNWRNFRSISEGYQDLKHLSDYSSSLSLYEDNLHTRDKRPTYDFHDRQSIERRKRYANALLRDSARCHSASRNDRFINQPVMQPNLLRNKPNPFQKTSVIGNWPDITNKGHHLQINYESLKVGKSPTEFPQRPQMMANNPSKISRFHGPPPSNVPNSADFHQYNPHRFPGPINFNQQSQMRFQPPPTRSRMPNMNINNTQNPIISNEYPPQPNMNNNNYQQIYPANQPPRLQYPPQMGPNPMQRMQQPNQFNHFNPTQHMGLNPQTQSYPMPNQMEGKSEEFRIFIAIYDYDPLVMSPNTASIEDELPFQEGQLVKIYGDCDEDGFYIGECNGMRGLIPSNMIQEIEVDTKTQVRTNNFINSNNNSLTRPNFKNPTVILNNTRQNLPQDNIEGQKGGHMAAMNAGKRQVVDNFKNEKKYQENNNNNNSSLNGNVKNFVALYDYDPHILSPNVDVEAELAFKVGNRIVVHGKMDEDGFYYGELENGKKGLVPSNFLQEVFDNKPNMQSNNMNGANIF